MADTRAFLAIGVEAVRGTKEATTVGFVPLEDFSLPKVDYMSKKRQGFRGEETALGATTEERWGEKWEGPFNMRFYTEAGGGNGIMGSLFKHFFGTATSSQNAATGQYRHMFYAVNDPFGPGATLESKGLTFNENSTQSGTLKNFPFLGGRVKKITLKQELGASLIMSIETMGQKLDTVTAGIASPTFAAENLRCDYNNLDMRMGATVTRTGTAPDYTALSSNGAVVKPDSVTIEIERGMVDEQVLDGTTSPGKTSVGELTGKLSMTIDYEDPASGFSSVDEFMAWIAGVSETNFFLAWNTGTQAGTGDNHMLIIDLPACNRLGGPPEIKRDGKSKITLEYDFHYSATTKYAIGMLLKNTAAAV